MSHKLQLYFAVLESIIHNHFYSYVLLLIRISIKIS